MNQYINIYLNKYHDKASLPVLDEEGISKIVANTIKKYLFDSASREEFKSLRDALYNSCDTCDIVEKYGKIDGMYFDKEKCRYVKKSPPPTARTLAEVRNAITSTCSKITATVDGVHEGKNIYISLLYNSDDSVTCYGGSELYKDSYGMGKYDIPLDLFTYLNEHFIDSMSRLFKKHNWLTDSVRVHVVGVTDGHGFEENYENERLNMNFNGYANMKIQEPIEMKPDEYSIIREYFDTRDCGTPYIGDKSFIFSSENSTQKIDNNIQLAYLRALPIQKMLESKFPQASIYVSRRPERNQQGTFRKIEIHMLIIGATLGMIGREQNRNVWLYRMNNCGD